ncbi:MAG: tRNA uridine(34) 5-carboxymethylaminomethyl modification radical SAM/GNAT enzyme Elp3 [Candidatus Thorarchaeota archaeon]
MISAILALESASRSEINRIKNTECKKHGLPRVPSNADLLQFATPEERPILSQLLKKRPVRTISGVAVVAVMTEPQRCPHGKCAYCPGGPEYGVPQSYTGHEPATLRGIQNGYDPYRQVESRLAQLRAIGHPTQKTELIVMGGDWCSKKREYREWFVKSCLDAMNGTVSGSLSVAKQVNERSAVRAVGVTFETRPDCITPESVDQMLEMGATRVELGVQTLYDSILELVERGHTVDATVRATQLVRDAGLKVAYHIMPGLPGSTPESDLAMFEQLFSDPRFRPDMLKIYPTVVVENTKLHEWYQQGIYRPYSTEVLVDMLARALAKMPEYVRLQRMQRDIPLHQIRAGLDVGNLRELVEQRMIAEGWRNPTIRFREVGHYEVRTGSHVNCNDLVLVRRDYEASRGMEIFLSFEDPESDVIAAFLRLRRPSDGAHRPEILEKPCAIIRELRVYGPMLELGRRDRSAWQHMGLGERLLREAEAIATECGASRILVNSGIGVKEYYRQLGYVDLGEYLARDLSS